MNYILDGHTIYLVDGLENTTSLTFEIDKPYTVQRDDAEEITVCSKGNSSTPHSQDVENVLLYTTEVPIKVIICVWSLLDNVRNLSSRNGHLNELNIAVNKYPFVIVVL